MTSCFIVDDSVDDLTLIKELCRKEGIEEVEVAKDGSQALDYCKTHTPDLIILDLEMPKVNGLEFLNLYKKLKPKYRPYIAICSVSQSDDDKVEAFSAGADEYIVKPLSRKKLEEVLENINMT